MSETFQQIGTRIGDLVTEKNAAYGSSFQTAGAALRLLYPNGIAPEQMEDALLIARTWDKLMRIATDKDAFGESPYGDICGYGILGVAMHQTRKEESWRGNANDPNATSVQPHPTVVSAAPSIKPRTTPSDDASSGKESFASSNASPESFSKLDSTSSERYAPAPIAPRSATAKEVALEMAIRLNAEQRCAFCALELRGRERFRAGIGEGKCQWNFMTCSLDRCSELLKAALA